MMFEASGSIKTSPRMVGSVPSTSILAEPVDEALLVAELVAAGVAPCAKRLAPDGRAIRPRRLTQTTSPADRADFLFIGTSFLHFNGPVGHCTPELPRPLFRIGWLPA